MTEGAKEKSSGVENAPEAGKIRMRTAFFTRARVSSVLKVGT